MRVLMLSVHFRPTVGGAERQAETLARALLARGVHVEVLTARMDPAWPATETVDGLAIHRFPLTDLAQRFPFLRGLGIPNLALERAQVRRAVLRTLPGFDLLHAHLASPVVAFARGAAGALGIPTLCKVACGGEDFDFRSLRRASVLGPRLVEQLVGSMDRWVAISEQVASDLRGAGVPPERIASIPNGIDLSRFPFERRSARARRFLCLGRLGKFDLASLLHGLEQLAREIPDVRLRIAGRGSPEAAEALLATLPLARARTEFVGFSPSAEEFASADALVHPSLADGMSNALLEAMALGIPCAASDIAPNREMLDGGRAGLLFRLGDPAGLAFALRVLAEDRERGALVALAARERAERRYAIDAVAEQYVALYRALAPSASPNARAG